jgi:hypothetical protein
MGGRNGRSPAPSANTAAKGASRIRFSGRLDGHALRVGRYRLTATPAHGKAHTVTFTVIAAPKHRAAHP